MRDYVSHGTKLTAAQVLELVPELSLVGDVEFVPFELRSVGSTALTAADWLAALAVLERVASDGFDGALLLHGTSTLEETAYFLSLTFSSAMPVAVVGAQRPIGTLSSDAGMNLVAGVRAVLDARGRDVGVVVVLDDTVHSARDAKKVANYSLTAFTSGAAGALARVDGDQVTWFRGTRTPHTVSSPFLGAQGVGRLRVDVVATYAGADGLHVDASVAAGAAGIVVSGAPPGLATPLQAEAVARAMAAGVVVVQGSRAIADRVPHRLAHAEDGVVSADDLPAGKARVLLLLALASGVQERGAVQAMFDRY